MACALTQNYTLGCRDTAGGIKTLYLIEFDNVSGITESAGTASAISKANNGRFWRYDLTLNTGEWNEEYNDSRENGTSFHKQNLDFVLNKMQASWSQEIKLLAQNRIIAVVADFGSKYWLLGQENGLMREGGKGGSGKAKGDRNGYELKFTSEQVNPALEVTSGIIAGLITP